MTETFLTFKEYNDIGLATEIGELLKANGIQYIIENNKYIFDVSLANNSINPDVSLKLRSRDFTKAQIILADYYKTVIPLVDKDYYLFEFSDQELIDIISKPDEWGELDYNLAQSILVDRGKEINPEIVKLLSEKRTKELSKPEKTSTYLIYRGYISAIFGGLFAIFFGYDLAYSKKTMRNGQQVFTYGQDERKHGERIVFIGRISFIIWLLVILYIKSNL